MSEITEPILLDKTGQEIAKALNMIAIAQASNVGSIESWPAVQQIVRQGLGPKAFPVGSLLKVTHTEYGTILLDVVAHDHNLDPTGRQLHSMTLLMRHCIYGRMFDEREMLWANTSSAAISAGTLSFALSKGAYNQSVTEDGEYHFTTTKPIPVGGGFRHTAIGTYRSSADLYTPENITGGTITTYDANGATLESGLAVSSGSSGTMLGTASVLKANTIDTVGRFNCTHRQQYGSNNWGESALRQWLNSASAANAWWQKATPFDRAPNYTNKAGFLNGLDAAFVSVLGEVDSTTACNTLYECDREPGSLYTTRDKLFLPSRVELGFGAENGKTEGSKWPYFDGAEDADRIKYDIVSPFPARYWWLRSAAPWNGSLARIVAPQGPLNGTYACDGHAAAAACTIY